MIKVSQPCIGQEEKDAVIRVLESGNLAAGEEVESFEREFARYVGKKHAVATSSGTTAQIAGINAINNPRTKAIVPAFTFFSIVSVVRRGFGTIIFTDVDREFPSINYSLVKEAITNDVGLVSPVNLYGKQCKELKEIHELCQDCDIPLLLDSCQAIAPWGADHSDVAVFSFYPTKNMTTGEGGMIVTDSPYIAEKCREFINHGQKEKYTHSSYGYNFRMTDIAAAIGREQLKKIDGFNTRRREIAQIYVQELTEITQNPSPISEKHVFSQFTVSLNRHINRTTFMADMAVRGIETAIHYPKIIPHQPMFMKQTLEKGTEFNNAERWANRVVSLPCHPGMTDDDVHAVIQAVKHAGGE